MARKATKKEQAARAIEVVTGSPPRSTVDPSPYCHRRGPGLTSCLYRETRAVADQVRGPITVEDAAPLVRRNALCLDCGWRLALVLGLPVTPRCEIGPVAPGRPRSAPRPIPMGEGPYDE